MDKQMFEFECPHCHASERWPADVHRQLQGQTFNCSGCKGTYPIPACATALVALQPVERIKIECPTCDKPFRLTPEQHEEMAGEELICSGCNTGFLVPCAETAMVAPASRSPARSKRKRQRTTPMKLSFPKGLGAVEAEVSQGTANTVVKTMSGGLLVAIGVFLAAMFGMRHNKSS